MPKLEYSPRAEAQLNDVWEYSTEQWGTGRADRYVRELDTACLRLIDHPRMGLDVRHYKRGYRRLTFGAHYIFYRVRRDGSVVVMAIIHQSRDLRRQLR